MSAALTMLRLISAYQSAAVAIGLRRSSIAQNVAALAQIMGRQPDNDTSTAILTRELVQTFVASQQAKGIRKTSIISTLRRARCIFSAWAIEDYAAQKMRLPDLTGFLRACPMKSDGKDYILPPADLIERTMREGRALADRHPMLYRAFALAAELGMRAGEIAACRFAWFAELDAGKMVVNIRDDEETGFRTKSKPRVVPVPYELAAEIRQWMAGAAASSHGYVLDLPTTWQRYNVLARELAAWMRGLGWDAQRWPKAAHELRKLCGSRWYTERNAQTAQAWLGHGSVAVTCKYYAALTAQPEPLARGA